MTVHDLNAYWHPDYPDLRRVGPRWYGACLDRGTLRLITPPAEAPVTLAEMRQHVRQDLTDDDTLLQAYLDAAVQAVEDQTGRALMAQTWQLDLDWGWAWERSLPIAPLLHVDAVGTRDAAGAETLIAPTGYVVHAPSGPTCSPGRIRLLSGTAFPEVAEGGAAFVRFTAGYGSTALVPAALRAAVRMLAADLYENREATAPGAARALTDNPTLGRLLAPYRVYGMAAP